MRGKIDSYEIRNSTVVTMLTLAGICQESSAEATWGSRPPTTNIDQFTHDGMTLTQSANKAKTQNEINDQVKISSHNI